MTHSRGGPVAPAAICLPNVPIGNLSHGPGTTLRHRLPMTTAPNPILGLGCMALFWTAMNLLGTLVFGLDNGWYWAIGLIGIVLLMIVQFVRRLLTTHGVGPTVVEVSAHPLHPGESCEVFVSQEGRLAINALRVALLCAESATYSDGTTTRTETRCVLDEEIFARAGFQIQEGQPFAARCALRVPAGAMHSFVAAHNTIQWWLVVREDVAGRPDIAHHFPLVVHPTPTDGGTK